MDQQLPKKVPTKLDASLISVLPAFSRLEQAQIKEILDCASVQRFELGDTIFYEDEPAQRFFMLLDGFVRVLRITEDGEQVVALHIPAGQLFGIAKALSRTTYPATAEAAAECLALSWNSNLWDKFASDYPGFLTETYRTVGKRLGEINDKMVELATKQVEQRIANAPPD